MKTLPHVCKETLTASSPHRMDTLGGKYATGSLESGGHMASAVERRLTARINLTSVASEASPTEGNWPLLSQHTHGDMACCSRSLSWAQACCKAVDGKQCSPHLPISWPLAVPDEVQQEPRSKLTAACLSELRCLVIHKELHEAFPQCPEGVLGCPGGNDS